MIDKLNSIESRYEELLERLADPAVQNDPAEYRTHAKALAEIAQKNVNARWTVYQQMAEASKAAAAAKAAPAAPAAS